MKKKVADSKIPAYVEVYNSLYSDLKNGVYEIYSSLPGETSLAEKYHVSRNTLRQALAILAEDGLITKSQGKDTIVSTEMTSVITNKHRNPLIDLCRQPIDSVQIQYNYGPPTDIAKGRLSLEAEDLILAADTVYQTGGKTAGYSFIQIPIKAFHELSVRVSDEDAVEHLTTKKIFEHCHHWNLTIKLIQVNELESPFLGVPIGQSLIMMEAILLNHDNIGFARCKFYFLPEYYSLKFRI